MTVGPSHISIKGANEHNLKNIDVDIERGKITVITGVSGSGKSSLAFDTVLAESQRRFFYTLSNYSRQFLDLGSRPSVKFIDGLSPAICLAQNETQPSKRATVGTLTDTTELLGVLWSRFGDQYCPDHNRPTSTVNVNEVAERILKEFDGETLAICAPLVEQKRGTFRVLMEAAAQKGFLRLFVDGKILPISPIPVLNKDFKHTIKIVVDSVTINSAKMNEKENKSKSRLIRSLKTAIEEGQGFAEYFVVTTVKDEKTLQLDKGSTISADGGCEVCGYSWPKLDARYFSPNSIGKCTSCSGLGVQDSSEEEEDGEQEHLQDRLGLRDACKVCKGSGINPKYNAIKILDYSIQDIQIMPINQLLGIFDEIKKIHKSNLASERLIEEIAASLSRVSNVGLAYLSLSRRIRSLSAGEAQRLKLAGILGDSLRGILYVLDEPSQGLHPSELELLWESIENLKDLGNTIIIVDHDQSLMRKADWIIDLGPGGGEHGGKLLAKFRPADVKKFEKISSTAKHLLEKNEDKVKSRQPKPTEFIEVTSPTVNNLKMPSVKFAKSRLNVVTGVSGAGKSSLVLSTLFPNIKTLSGLKQKSAKKSWRNCKKIEGAACYEMVNLIDRRPIAKSSVSMPASYLDVFTDIRNLFAKTPEAQIAGLTARSFSLSVEAGRCLECKGRGEVTLSMRFLTDARTRCTVCNGQRYRPHVLGVTYNGLNMNEILQQSIADAAVFFKHHKKISARLQPALDLGLGYLKLGQPSGSLSGGEAQRLKIVPYLAKRHGGNSILVMDEPTTGLHGQDAAKLIKSLHRLVVLGATVVLIEHSAEVIFASDWIIDVGPGSAAEGGNLIYQGDVDGFVKMKDSITAKYLRA